MKALVSALIPLLLLPGCFSPNFDGQGQFFCRGDKKCPGGYTCQAEVCVKNGDTVDGSVTPDVLPDGPIGEPDGGVRPAVCQLGAPRLVAPDVNGSFGFDVDPASGELAVSAIQGDVLNVYFRPAERDAWEGRAKQDPAQGHTAVVVRGGTIGVAYRDEKAFPMLFILDPDGTKKGPKKIEDIPGGQLALAYQPPAGNLTSPSLVVAYQSETPDATSSPTVTLRVAAYLVEGLQDRWAPTVVPDEAPYGSSPTVLASQQGVLVAYLQGGPGAPESVPKLAVHQQGGGWKVAALDGPAAPRPEFDGLAVVAEASGIHAVRVNWLEPNASTLVYLPPANIKGGPQPIMIGDRPLPNVGRPALAVGGQGQAVAFIDNATGELRVTGRLGHSGPWMEPGVLDDTVGGAGASQVELGVDEKGGMHIVYRVGGDGPVGEVRYRDVNCELPRF